MTCRCPRLPRSGRFRLAVWVVGGQDPDRAALRSSWSGGCPRCHLEGRGLSWVLPGLAEEKQVAPREFGDRVGRG